MWYLRNTLVVQDLNSKNTSGAPAANASICNKQSSEQVHPDTSGVQAHAPSSSTAAASKTALQQLRTDNAQLRTDNAQLRTDKAQRRTDKAQRLTDNAQLRTDNAQLRTDNAQPRNMAALAASRTGPCQTVKQQPARVHVQVLPLCSDLLKEHLIVCMLSLTAKSACRSQCTYIQSSLQFTFQSCIAATVWSSTSKQTSLPAPQSHVLSASRGRGVQATQQPKLQLGQMTSSSLGKTPALSLCGPHRAEPHAAARRNISSISNLIDARQAGTQEPAATTLLPVTSDAPETSRGSHAIRLSHLAEQLANKLFGRYMPF